MPTAKAPPATTQLYEHLGAGIRKLVAALPEPVTYQDEINLGKTLDGMIQAAVKAVLPGSQSTKQVRGLQQQARQAVARKLARKLSALEAK